MYSAVSLINGRIQRIRMELEDKAKVVASACLGAEFVQFLATLAVLPWPIWKKRTNSSYFSKATEAKQLARQGIEQTLSPKQTRRPLPCLLILSFFYGSYSSIQCICTLYSTSEWMGGNVVEVISAASLLQDIFSENVIFPHISTNIVENPVRCIIQFILYYKYIIGNPVRCIIYM